MVLFFFFLHPVLSYQRLSLVVGEVVAGASGSAAGAKGVGDTGAGGTALVADTVDGVPGIAGTAHMAGGAVAGPGVGTGAGAGVGVVVGGRRGPEAARSGLAAGSCGTYRTETLGYAPPGSSADR